MSLTALAATLAMIPILTLEADASGGWHTFAVAANWVIWAVFVVEFFVVLAVAERKRAALRAHRLDVGIVVVTVPLFGRFLSSLRLVRLARLLRLLRASMIVGRAVRAERSLSSGDAFRLLALIIVFIVVVAGATQSSAPTLLGGPT